MCSLSLFLAHTQTHTICAFVIVCTNMGTSTFFSLCRICSNKTMLSSLLTGRNRKMNLLYHLWTCVHWYDTVTDVAKHLFWDVGVGWAAERGRLCVCINVHSRKHQLLCYLHTLFMCGHQPPSAVNVFNMAAAPPGHTESPPVHAKSNAAFELGSAACKMSGYTWLPT